MEFMQATTDTTQCRILYLVGQLGRGGLERQLYYLLQAMDRETYRPAVAVWNYNDADPYTAQIRALGIPCYPLPDGTSAPVKLRAFRSLVQQIKPEVVHSYTFYTNIAAHSATLGTSIVAVGSVRSAFSYAKKDSGWWLGKLSARWPRTLICNSISAFNEMQESKGFFVPKKPFVVWNGIDLQRFCNDCTPQYETPTVVGIGSLLPVKRWDRLIDVAHRLKKRGLKFSVQIVGDGPLRASLAAYVQHLGVDDCVQLVGKTDDVSSLLKKAHFAVHTSDSEGCPNAVMEAMACGRPVVATAVGDTAYLLEDGLSGFLVPRNGRSVLTARMATLLSQPDLCQRMGEAARSKAEQLFSLDRLVSQTLAVYRAAGWKDN